MRHQGGGQSTPRAEEGDGSQRAGGTGREPTTGELPGLSPAPAGNERLVGTVDRVTFHSPDTGFCVLRVQRLIEGGGGGPRGLVPVVGRAPRVAPGEYVEAEGEWQRDPQHGVQFRARELRVASPSTPEGMKRYLGSGTVHGVGPELADRLVAHFGADVFDVIEQRPARLREVKGVGPVRASQIAEAWGDQRRVREIMVFLHSHGIGSARAVRIHKVYGHDALDLIRADPYRLARDIRGIGFHTADELARSLGVAPGASVRVRAGLHHVLSEARSEGHCGLPSDALAKRAERLLEASPAVVQKAVDDEVGCGALLPDEAGRRPCLFPRDLYQAERSIASSLLRLQKKVRPWPDIDTAKAIPWAEQRLEITLSAGQRDAVAAMLGAKVGVLTGGPGVGKTTLLRSLLDIVEAKGVQTLLAAPTGRAARRLQESTGRSARTVHRALEVDPRSGGFLRGKGRPLDANLVVIDEASMLDAPLARSLFAAVPEDAAVWLIGDVDQLPSVGPGRVLADIIEAGTIPVVRLGEIFRQAAESAIVRSAHRVLQGEVPDLKRQPDGDFFFVGAEDPERAVSLIVDVVAKRIPERFGLDPVRDVQVLCPMRRGSLGSISLGRELQATLNANVREGVTLERFGSLFAEGDKVMQLSNNYDKDVYNGDVGFVRRLDPGDGLVVDFEGRRLEYAASELDEIAPCYATTIHKAQGSEYPAVVIALSSQHQPMLQRNLVYTAITRGRKLVVIVGQRRALATAVRRGDSGDRVTKLREWLGDEALRP